MDRTDLKQTIVERFRRALTTYDDNARAQQQIAGHLANLLSIHAKTPVFEKAVDLGCGTGLLTESLLKRYRIRHFVLNDLYREAVDFVRGKFPSYRFETLVGDAESLLFKQHSFDLIASASAIQWFVNPVDFFARIHQYLTPGGYLLIASYAPGNLDEFAALTGEGISYPDLADISMPGLDILEYRASSEDAIRLLFATPLDVLRHLRDTGVTGTRVAHNYWTPEKLNAFIDEYNRRFRTSNGVTLTYRPVYLLACRTVSGETPTSQKLH